MSDILSSDIGGYFEKYTVKQLKKEGYAILEQNFRTNKTEIDIIAKEGSTIVFVEVKARGPATLHKPEDDADREKARNISKTAVLYLSYLNKRNIDLNDFSLRFDCASLRFDNQYNITEYKYMKNYFKVNDENLFRPAL